MDLTIPVHRPDIRKSVHTDMGKPVERLRGEPSHREHGRFVPLDSL